MYIERELLDVILARVRSVIEPTRIILFGSAATGEFGQDSDIDLLLLVSPESNTWENRVRVRKVLRGLGVPIDVLMMNTDEFETTKDVIGGIAYPAHKYGEVLYDAA